MNATQRPKKLANAHAYRFAKLVSCRPIHAPAMPPRRINSVCPCRAEAKIARRIESANGMELLRFTIQPSHEQLNEANCSVVARRYYSAVFVSAIGIVAATTHIDPIQGDKKSEANAITRKQIIYIISLTFVFLCFK